MNELSKYIHISKYARYIDSESRRETWEETVGRYITFWCERYDWLQDSYAKELYESIHDMKVMPSMRALFTAGPALERDNAAGYNCAAIAINHYRCFDEMFYLLMCGCGVGFSVERQYINSLPTLPEGLENADITIRVRDSKIGWASALKELISLLYSGSIPTWDVSGVRPAGTRLKTFGGRASGPEPLNRLFNFVVNTFKQAVGDRRERLNSLMVHDICCNIADAVVAGNVRRAACISFSNLTDDRMRRAKQGQFPRYRYMSNNSVAYTEKPDLASFLKEFSSLHKSKSGERGLVNKEALDARANELGREHSGDYLLNPCGEAILRDTGGLCNLTEVIVRPDDTLDSLKKKVKYAAILGTLQSTLTNFRYLRKIWKTNAEDERLLGVSLTGVMDHPVLNNEQAKVLKYRDEFNITNIPVDAVLPKWLNELKEVAIETNKEWAEKLGIPVSKQLTLVKPSGTVSKLVDCGAGLHTRPHKYYIQRVTQDMGDPITQLMIDQGVPYEKDGDKYYFSFFKKSPDESLVSKDVGALQQLNLWKIYRDIWCQGNPSQTIYYDDSTFLSVMEWVWENWDGIGGLSFFEVDDTVYPILMIEEINEDEYNHAIEHCPVIDWSKLPKYEREDSTTGAQEFACGGGNCEI